jgi:DNA-binding XRE family transcriptional regulator
MAIRTQTTPLEVLRRQLEPRVSQEKLAHKSGIVLQTYRNAEMGKDILLSHAFSILEALNDEREVRGLAPVSFEQLWRSAPGSGKIGTPVQTSGAEPQVSL